MERMERREVLASGIGAIEGVAFVDQNGDGLPTGDPPVLVDGFGDLIGPGLGGTGVTIQLFEDTNTNGTFDSGTDLLVGTDTSDSTDGSYRFDNLTVGTYFLTQQSVPQLNTPASVTVQVTNEGGTRAALIDDYSQTTQNVSANGGATELDFASAPEVIGGERDIEVTNNAVGGQVTVFADDATDTLSVLTGLADGTALIQYDGVDGTIALNATGLGNASLGGGAAGDALDPNSGLVVLSRAQDAGDTLTITVYTDAVNFSETTITIPQDPTTPIETFVPFSTFTATGGTGANFNDVGAIEADVVVATDNDIFVSIVETIRPDVVTANYANILPVTLGGEIFLDNGDPGQNDGTRDVTEPGVTGVTVQLHQLALPTDTVDPLTSVPLSSTVTGANGAYSFAGLDPGHYAVVIPASQFQGGAQLFGFANSTGNDPAPDPDDDTDGDDNGTSLVSGEVISGTITLESNSEPVNDDDADANTNTTLDLGFFPQIDLSITKTLNVAGSSVIADGNLVFDIVVQNDGPLDATNVEVEDVIPAGLTFTGIQNASGAFTPTVNGSTLTVAIGTIPASGSVNFQITADVDANQTADITNTATVSGTEVDIDTLNNTEDELVDFPESDLRITKTDSPDPVSAGNQLTYTIEVTNDGPDSASGVQVTDPLPAGVDFSSGDVNGDANLVVFDTNSRIVTASVGTLANGATATITIVVDVDADASGPLSNSATVTATPNTDPSAANNTTPATDTTVDRDVDLSITKTPTGTPIAGQSVTYTIVVTNAGPGQARGVSVVDTLDANLTFDATSFDGGPTGVTFTENGQQLTFDVGTLDPAASATFSFDVDIASSATGTIDNFATVSTTDNDTDNTNDTNPAAPLNVTQQVDLSLAKTVDLQTAVPGQDQLVYTFTIDHTADSFSDATNVTLTDTLPAGVVGAVINAPNATNTDFSNGVVTVEFASIPIGSSETFTVTVDTESTATGTVVNTGTVSSSVTDFDPSDNTDDATTTLTPDFDISITKAVSDATPEPTDSITYTIDITNSGPSTATGVVLTDPIPAGLTFVSGTLGGQSPTEAGGVLTFSAITIAPNTTETATIVMTVDASTTGTVTNTASTNDLSAAGENDVTNNSANVDIDVTAIVDLEVTKTVSETAAQAGDSLTYTIDVTNNGPSLAQNVTVQDTLPSGVTFVSGTGPNNTQLTENAGVVDFNAGDLTNGETIQLAIVVSIPAGTAGDQINTVTVATTTNEPVTGNNTATATTNVDPLTSSISGVVYFDLDNDGIQDAGEAGIENVVITLSGTDTLGNAVNATVNTDANGNYEFLNLAAGTYIVTQTQPAGIRDGMETLGTGATATVADNVFSNLGLGQATDAVGFNFGEIGEILSKRRFLGSSI